MPSDYFPSLEIDNNILPTSNSLYQNYPNPFNPITVINYSLKKDSNVNISIYDMLGRVVNNLVSGKQKSGYRSVQWNGTNSMGERVSAGIYLYRIISRDHKESRKMILVK